MRRDVRILLVGDGKFSVQVFQVVDAPDSFGMFYPRWIGPGSGGMVRFYEKTASGRAQLLPL